MFSTFVKNYEYYTTDKGQIFFRKITLTNGYDSFKELVLDKEHQNKIVK